MTKSFTKFKSITQRTAEKSAENLSSTKDSATINQTPKTVEFDLSSETKVEFALYYIVYVPQDEFIYMYNILSKYVKGRHTEVKKTEWTIGQTD